MRKVPEQNPPCKGWVEVWPNRIVVTFGDGTSIELPMDVQQLKKIVEDDTSVELPGFTLSFGTRQYRRKLFGITITRRYREEVSVVLRPPNGTGVITVLRSDFVIAVEEAASQ